jgi:tetratricopeptide (TPR) repeat protein
MKSVAKLKEQARLHEQREEWDKAIQAYRQILEMADPAEGEVELSIYNRVGDLHLRVGRQAEAVGFYEQAADRYAEAGLYNNAIALCNKALRHAPHRIDLYRRLGQLSAAQGFFTDGRRWYQEFAERKIKLGDPEAALEALEEFAEASSEAEDREILAERLLALDRTERALEQLRLAYRMRLRAEETDAAEAVRARILELDPGADLTDIELGLDEPSPEGDRGEYDGELPGLGLESAAASAGLGAVDSDAVGFETDGLADVEDGGTGDEAVACTADGFEPTAYGEVEPDPEPDVAAGAAALDFDGGDAVLAEPDVSAEVDDEETEFVAPLPLLDTGIEFGEVAIEAEAADTVEPVGEPEGVETAAPAVWGDNVAATDEYVDLASLLADDEVDVGTRFVVEGIEPTGDEDRDFLATLAEFKAKVSEHVGVDDPASHYDLGLAFKEMGLVDEAIAEFQVALRGTTDRLKILEELGHCFYLKGQYAIATKILERALQLPVDDDAGLLGVYYQLGRSLEELGRTAEARDAYERVVAVDIHFKDAAERLERL